MYLAMVAWCIIVIISIAGSLYVSRAYGDIYKEWIAVKSDYEQKMMLVNSKDAKTINYFYGQQQAAHSITSHVMTLIQRHPIVIISTRDLPVESMAEYMSTEDKKVDVLEEQQEYSRANVEPQNLKLHSHSVIEIEVMGTLLDILQCIDELNDQVLYGGILIESMENKGNVLYVTLRIYG